MLVEKLGLLPMAAFAYDGGERFTMPYISSSQRLARALQDAGAPHELVLHASLGYFEAWKSPLKFPKLALLDELRRARMDAFALRVIAGEFDDDPQATREHYQQEFKRLMQAKWKM